MNICMYDGALAMSAAERQFDIGGDFAVAVTAKKMKKMDKDMAPLATHQSTVGGEYRKCWCKQKKRLSKIM